MKGRDGGQEMFGRNTMITPNATSPYLKNLSYGAAVITEGTE